jgi:hypothetical protein
MAVSMYYVATQKFLFATRDEILSKDISGVNFHIAVPDEFYSLFYRMLDR